MRTNCLTVLLMIAVVVSGCNASSDQSTMLISAGTEVANTHWTARTVVAIARPVDVQSNKSFCSGTLLSDTAVLTAAHCITGTMTDNYVSFGPLVTDDSTWLRKIKKVIRNPDYNPVVPHSPHDLAILVLESPAPFGTSFATIAAPTVEYSNNQEALLVGFGSTNDVAGTGKLRMATGHLTSEHASSNLITVTGDGNSNTCTGDSGGPVFFQVGPEIVIGGVTSWGPSCTFSTVSHYVDLRKYVDWMLGVAASENL